MLARLAYACILTFIFFLSIPLLVLCAMGIVMSSGFPILFRQKRIGKNGKVFTIIKFRTMKVSADREKYRYKNRNESDGPVFKMYNDPRFTAIGRILSHTGLDELPQIVNVIRGEMSLIGPRPFPIAEAKKLKLWMRVREQVLPGIISPAILTGAYHRDFRGWMRHDVAYVHTKHPYKDVMLCINAIPFMARMFMQSVLGR